MRSSTQPITGPRARRAGFSMMMVIAVVAVAAVLGMALLSSNTLQAKASHGRVSVAQAESLAESGLNRALYYLQNHNDPAKCPFSIPVGGSYSEGNVSLGSAVKGTYDLTIERRSQNRYWVKATGKTPSPQGVGLRKTVTAYVDLNYTLYAMSFESDVTIPPGVTVNGDVYCNGDLVNNGQINGSVLAKSVNGSGSQEGFSLLGAVDDLLSGVLNLLFPQTTTVNHYTTYTWQGRTYFSKNIFTSSLSNTTLGPTSDNPAGVFVKIGTLDLNGKVTINGTLVVIGGSLRVQGQNNLITPAETFPALLVDQDLMFKQPGSALDVRGLTWFAGRITKASGSVVNSSLRVTGAVFNPGHGNTTIDPVFGTVRVDYDRVRSSVKGWNSANANPPPLSVTVVGWKAE